MKTLSYKALCLIINISLVLYLLGGVMLTLMVTQKGFLEESTTFTIRIPTKSTYNLDPTTAKVEALKPDVTDEAMVAGRVGIEFKTSSTFIKSMFIGVGIISFGYSLLILFTVRAFVNSLSESSAFVSKNVKRLRLIGILLICIEPLNALQNYLMHSVVDEYFSHTILSSNGIGYTIGYWFGSNTASGSYFSSWIVAGLIILVIAEVFKQGLILKQEQDLTI